jgi:hypothetical protein
MIVSVEPVRCAACGRQFHPGQVTGLTVCPVCGAPGFGACGLQATPPPGKTARTMGFVNPVSGRVERLESVWLWVLLFGWLYFAAKGVWFHAVAGLLLALCTGGLSWLVYPFFARRIMRAHYRRRGWQPLR